MNLVVAFARWFVELHRDDEGEIPVGPILVIALVVIQLGLLLMTFGEQLFTWFDAKWAKVKAK